jgi:hypothetical protein
MLVHAHRGNTLAAGAVVLAALAAELELRADAPLGVRLGLAAALGVLALAGALGSPVEDDGPRTYQEILLALTALAATAVAAHGLVVVGAADGPGLPAWGVALSAVAGAATGLALTRARGGTIVLGVAAMLAVVAAVVGAGAAWPGDDPRGGARLALLASAAVLVVQLVLRLERRFRQALVLADVLAGVVVLFAATFLLDDVPGATAALGLPGGDVRAGTGWELLLLAAGLGLVGLGATLHERGPGWVAALSLVAALAVLADDGARAWPVALAAIGVGLVLVALRPVAHRFPDPAAPTDDPPPPVPFPRPPLSLAGSDRDRDDGED